MSEGNEEEFVGAPKTNDSQVQDVETIKSLDDMKKPSVTVSKTAAIVLVLALGAHAFFEGIAFGLITTIEQAG